MLFDDPHCGTLSFLLQKTFCGYHNAMISLLNAGYNVQKLLNKADLDDMEINSKIVKIMQKYPFATCSDVNFFYKSWHYLFDKIVYIAIARHAITIIQNMLLFLLVQYSPNSIIYRVPILATLTLLCLGDSIIDCVPKILYNALLIPVLCFLMYNNLYSVAFYNYTEMWCMLYKTYEFLLYYRCNKLAQITDDCYVYHKNKVIGKEYNNIILNEKYNYSN